MRTSRIAPFVATSLLLASIATCATATAAPTAQSPSKTPTAAGLLGQWFSVDIDSEAFLPSGKVGDAVLRWNPCEPIRWAINPAGAPKGFEKEARRAATELAHASGLVMSYAGLTNLMPTQHGGVLDDGPIRAAGLQLVIAWDHHGATSLLGTDPAEAGATMRQASGGTTATDTGMVTSPTQYDVAAISFDLSQRAYLVKHDNRGDGLYRALLHELGHAAGLNHVSNPTEIMYAVGTPQSALHYTVGDKAGLKKLGFAGGCL